MWPPRERSSSCVADTRRKSSIGRAFNLLYAKMTGGPTVEDGIEILTTPMGVNEPGMGHLEDTGVHETVQQKQRWVARAVMIVAAVMFLMSVLLVAVTLSLTDHFDEMVRKMNGKTTVAPSIDTEGTSSSPYNITNNS